MALHNRPRGYTLRRSIETGSPEEVRDLVNNPHGAGHEERLDEDFRVAMKCNKCHKLAFGPRSLMRGAMEEHQRTDCSARHTKADEVQVFQILYPKQ